MLEWSADARADRPGAACRFILGFGPDDPFAVRKLGMVIGHDRIVRPQSGDLRGLRRAPASDPVSGHGDGHPRLAVAPRRPQIAQQVAGGGHRLLVEPLAGPAGADEQRQGFIGHQQPTAAVDHHRRWLHTSDAGVPAPGEHMLGVLNLAFDALEDDLLAHGTVFRLEAKIFQHGGPAAGDTALVDIPSGGTQDQRGGEGEYAQGLPDKPKVKRRARCGHGASVARSRCSPWNCEENRCLVAIAGLGSRAC